MHCGKLAVTVCTVENLLTSWFSMYCGKLAITVCIVNRHLTLCVVWKTYGHRVYCGKLTVTVCTVINIVCDVENLRSPCVSSTNI